MTQEQRIINLENEISNLKEELNKNRKANVWKKVKDKFSAEFNSFNWTFVHKTTDYKGKELVFKHDRVESYHISQAIGTIVRITLKRRGLNYLEETDLQKAEEITKQILEIMKKEKEEIK